MDKLKTANLTGAVAAVVFYATSILVFVFRLAGIPGAAFWPAMIEFALFVPLAWLLARAPALGRPALYYVQISLLLLWLAAELLLDYVLCLDFRHMRGLLIGYVVLFFAAGGGMIGVAARAGRGWLTAAAALFLASGALAFAQHYLAGV